jgi:hypothetical protein
MKLSKKAIDIVESSIKKFIDEYEPFDYSDELTNFVRIDPYILWNKYQKKYTINLFYIFDDNLTLLGKHSAYEHGKKILNELKQTLSFIGDSDTDIHIVTKDDYKKYTDVLIPKVRNLIPENKMNKRNEEYYQKIDRILNKFLSTYKSQIDDDNFFLLLRSPQYNFVCKWRMDGKWRMGNSDRVKVTIEELEEILNYNQL